MNNIISDIEEKVAQNKKMMALLIDPEKCTDALLERYKVEIHRSKPDYIFIGGSQLRYSAFDLVEKLRATHLPLILFPGNYLQLCDNVDAMLVLSLISGRNPEFLIEQHIRAAATIKASGIETIPTGYILIDGGKRSSVSKASHTRPIMTTETQLIRETAMAGQILGMRAIYLEAGSGAKNSVPTSIISRVKAAIDIPLIVGGGIRSAEQASDIAMAGADVVVIGNYLEQHPEEMTKLVQAIRNAE